MAIDPVCKMPVEAATAAASLGWEGTRFYFCSDSCRQRFRANPGDYRPTSAATSQARDGTDACAGSHGHIMRWNAAAFGIAASSGLVATAFLLAIYFGALTLVSGWSFVEEQFGQFWPYIVALAIGFGIQVGLFVYLRRAVRAAASGKVVAATGTTSGAAMVSCCTHYLVNLLPALGATGLVSFVGQYQVQLFWLGLAANLAGITYIGRRLASFASGG